MKVLALLLGGLFVIAPQLTAQTGSATPSPAAVSSAVAAPAAVKSGESACKKEKGDCITAALDVMSIIGPPQIPEGVTYHKGSAEDNSKASSMLFALLASQDDDGFESVVKDVLVCGPGLWLEMHKALDGKLSDTSKLFVIFAGPPARQGEGRGLRTPADRKIFLRALRKRFSGKIAWIRRPKPQELSYFWLTISFDIDEPIFMADIDGHILLANFSKGKDGLHLNWLDEVVDPSRFPASGKDAEGTAADLVERLAGEGKAQSPPPASGVTSVPATKP